MSPDRSTRVVGAEEQLEDGSRVPVETTGAQDRWAEGEALARLDADLVAACPDVPVHIIGCTCGHRERA